MLHDQNTRLRLGENYRAKLITDFDKLCNVFAEIISEVEIRLIITHMRGQYVVGRAKSVGDILLKLKAELGTELGGYLKTLSAVEEMIEESMTEEQYALFFEKIFKSWQASK